MMSYKTQFGNLYRHYSSPKKSQSKHKYLYGLCIITFLLFQIDPQNDHHLQFTSTDSSITFLLKIYSWL